MLIQSPLLAELARQRVAELQEAARRRQSAGGGAHLPRGRVYAGQVLISLGTRLAAAEPRATNRVTEPAGR